MKGISRQSSNDNTWPSTLYRHNIYLWLIRSQGIDEDEDESDAEEEYSEDENEDESASEMAEMKDDTTELEGTCRQPLTK